VVFAQEEARALNHDYIGTEHILLGLIREGKGVAVKALEALGISPESLRERVEEVIGHGEETPQGHIPFTPRAKSVLQLSLQESRQLGHHYIGTEHILLGLLDESDGIAGQVLLSAGASPDGVRQQVTRLLADYQRAARPETRGGQEPRS
jgi:ATP-dependent Clp protease ATP-binding subunit ClpC